MARTKQKTHIRHAARSGKIASPDAATGSRLKDYICMNMVFYAFCLVQLVFVRLLLRDFAGLYFFFGFIMCAFLVASIFDFLATRLEIGLPAEDKS